MRRTFAVSDHSPEAPKFLRTQSMQPLMGSWTISGFFTIARDPDACPNRPVTNLEVAVKAGEPEAIGTAHCNHCHWTSQRQLIKIERRVDNPYMQSFE